MFLAIGKILAVIFFTYLFPGFVLFLMISVFAGIFGHFKMRSETSKYISKHHIKHP